MSLSSMPNDRPTALGSTAPAPARSEARMVETASDAFRFEALDVDAAARHVEAWGALADRSLEPNPFMDPGFCLPAARHLAAKEGVGFLFIWDGGLAAPAGLVAVCALARPTSRLRHLASLWFHDLSALGAPLLDRDAAFPALCAVLTYLRRHRGGQAGLVIAAVPTEGATADLLRQVSARTARRVRSLEPRARAVLGGAGSQPAGLDATSRRHGKELRRQRRRLAALGTLRFESTEQLGDTKAAAERFLTLEAQGWKGRAGTALAGAAPRAAFTREMVKAMGARGRCRIDTLWLGTEPLAMGIVLTSGDRQFFWKTAYAEPFAKLSPGVQFVLDLTEAQRARPGIALTDSCAMPDHPMIDRLWPDRMSVADMVVETTPGAWRFSAALALESGRRAARAAAKRLYLRWRARH